MAGGVVGAPWPSWFAEGFLVAEPLDPCQGAVVGYGAGGWGCWDNAAHVGFEVADFPGQRFIDSEGNEGMDPMLFFVIAVVNYACDAFERLLATWVHRAGARTQ